MIHFLSELMNDTSKYNDDENLEIKWIDINEIKTMNKEKFRSYPVVQSIINSIEDDKFYELDIFNKL